MATSTSTASLRTALPSEDGASSISENFIGKLQQFTVPSVGEYMARVFPAKKLMEEFPPVWNMSHKKVMYQISTPNLDDVEGDIVVKGWPECQLPNQFPTKQVEVSFRQDAFDYAKAPEGELHWYLNFADPVLFVAYSSRLFAQDEMQCAMIPVLGCIKEAYLSAGYRPMTVINDKANPFTFRGVQHRLNVKLDPNVAQGRPRGLYGNALAGASEEAVRKASSKVTPPVMTNVLAMAAPEGGYGSYKEETIRHVLATCYTGYRAIVAETEAQSIKEGRLLRVVLHTGHWGCGAYGGNKTLMAALQIAAAQLSGLDAVVYHTFVDYPPAEAAYQMLKGMTLNNVEEFIKSMVAKNFKWGVSDGN